MYIHHMACGWRGKHLAQFFVARRFAWLPGDGISTLRGSRAVWTSNENWLDPGPFSPRAPLLHTTGKNGRSRL